MPASIGTLPSLPHLEELAEAVRERREVNGGLASGVAATSDGVKSGSGSYIGKLARPPPSLTLLRRTR